MIDEEIRRRIIDEEHLRILSICYYVSAGMIALMSLFGLLYVVIGVIVFVSQGPGAVYIPPGQPPPKFMGALLMGMGMAMFVFGILGTILKIVAGIRIRQKRSRTFCMVIAGIGCLEFPYGTLLGVFSFIVLGRNSVRRLFEPPREDCGQSSSVEP